MIGFFRSIFQSKIGLFLTLAFVGLIAVAFASSDITGSTFGGVTGSNAASVGKYDIATGDLSRSVNSAFEGTRQQNPQLDLATFIDQGGLEQVLNQLINGYALQAFGDRHGMIVSKRLLDSEIASIGAFRGPDGEFSEEIYRQVLQGQGLTDNIVRGDILRNLLSEQIAVPVSFGIRAPDKIVSPYASLVLEQRQGRIAIVPSVAYVPDKEPDNQTLAAYYSKNSKKFIRPEERVVNYAVFGAENLGDSVNPTDKEISDEYNRRAKEFAASETRTFTQVILPTEQAAKAIIAKVTSGTTLTKAADEVGLTASEVSSVGKEQYSETSSVAVSDAVFKTAKGRLSAPARSGLGWHVARIDNISTKPARSLAQVRELLSAELREQKTAQLIAENTELFEDEFSAGSTLSEVANAQKLKIQKTPSLRSSGQAPAQSSYQPDETVQRLLPSAFSMEEESGPQLVELIAGQKYAMFSVSNIKRAAPPPLKEIREQVVRSYMLEEGSKKAKVAAEKVKKQIAGGTSLEKAMAGLGIRTPPIEKVGAARGQIMQEPDKVPPPIKLMFAMLENTAKVLETPGKQGWQIVFLDKIVRGDASKQAELVERTREGFRPLFADEITQQFLTAVKNEVGVERDQSSINAVSDQLTGRDRTN